MLKNDNYMTWTRTRQSRRLAWSALSQDIPIPWRCTRHIRPSPIPTSQPTSWFKCIVKIWTIALRIIFVIHWCTCRHRWSIKPCSQALLGLQRHCRWSLDVHSRLPAGLPRSVPEHVCPWNLVSVWMCSYGVTWDFTYWCELCDIIHAVHECNLKKHDSYAIGGRIM